MICHTSRMNYNGLTLLLHITLISSLTLIALRLGKEALIAWLSLLIVAVNFFVLKQVTLFGLDVTCCDSIAVGYLLGMNLIQEFFGQTTARKTVWITFFVSVAFLLLAQIHLAYRPSPSDQTQLHFIVLFKPMARIVSASLFTFLIVQRFNIFFFGFLQRITQNKKLWLRTLMALLASTTLDTLLFSFLGLYGIAANLSHVIVFSLIIKIITSLISTPFVLLAKKTVQRETI